MNCTIHMNGFHIIGKLCSVPKTCLSKVKQKWLRQRKGMFCIPNAEWCSFSFSSTHLPQEHFPHLFFIQVSTILFKSLTGAFCLETSLTVLQELPLSPVSSWIRPLNFHIKITRISLLTRKDFRDLVIGTIEKQQEFSSF